MSGHDARPDQPSGGRNARRGERHGAGRMPSRQDALHGPNDQPAGRAEARVSRYDHVDDFAARHAALDDDAPGAAGLLGPSADPTTRGLLGPSADPAARAHMTPEQRRAWREERRRAAARRRRQRLLRRAVPFGAAVVLLGAGAGVLLAGGDDTPTKPAGEQRTADDLGAQTAAAGPLAVTRELGGLGSGGPTLQLAGARNAFEIDWKVPPRAGLVFDLDDGRVLWRKNALKPLPIASVTKMMTALVVTDTLPPEQKIRITKAAINTDGSKVGVLPVGKWIGQSSALHGLMLASGNDTAIALARQAGDGSVPRFVRKMSRRAEQMGLPCTRFSSPSGLVDEGNHSCAADLAVLARAVLDDERLAPIVGRRQAVLPFPVKGGKLWLYNHNPLLKEGYPGTIGIKTGYTDAAGKTFVAAVRHKGHRYGVVLLHSPDIRVQTKQLLQRTYRADADA